LKARLDNLRSRPSNIDPNTLPDLIADTVTKLGAAQQAMDVAKLDADGCRPSTRTPCAARRGGCR